MSTLDDITKHLPAATSELGKVIENVIVNGTVVAFKPSLSGVHGQQHVTGNLREPKYNCFCTFKAPK